MYNSAGCGVVCSSVFGNEGKGKVHLPKLCRGHGTKRREPFS